MKLLRMSELIDLQVNNLFQSPNYVALMFERGEGKYNINWNNKEKVG